MRKGITFIQMISIIMIIGVIAVIALPEITNPLVIQQKSAFKNDVLQLIDTIEREEVLTNNNFDRTILTVENLKQELNVDTVNYKYLEVT